MMDQPGVRFPKALLANYGRTFRRYSIVQRFGVSRNHSSNERSQSAPQTYMVGTTALDLWLVSC